MKKRWSILSFIMIMMMLPLVSCAGNLGKKVEVGWVNTPIPVINPADPYAWFDKPLDTFEIPRAPYEIVLHGSAYQGIAAIELRITGEEVLTFNDPASGASLVTLKHTWTPVQAGRYVLQARTRDKKDQWSQTSVVAVTVIEGPTPTPVPSMTPTAVPVQVMGFSEPVFNPGAISQSNSCEPKQVTAKIQVMNPAGIKVVAVFYRLLDVATGDISSWANTAMQELGNGQYKIDLQPAPVGGDLRGFVNTHWESQGSSFSARVQMQFAIQTNSNEIIRSPVYTAATLYPCAP